MPLLVTLLLAPHLLHSKLLTVSSLMFMLGLLLPGDCAAPVFLRTIFSSKSLVLAAPPIIILFMKATERTSFKIVSVSPESYS